MAQTIKHRRGKLESVKDITPINGELIIASGSDLSVHQEGLLFVGVEGNVLTPSNKILTGSSAISVTGNDYDHAIDGVPYYDTSAKNLTILGKGGNTDVILATNSLDLGGSGIVSSSAQVGINNNSITVGSGSGVNVTGDGSFTLNQGSDETFVFSIDSGSIAGSGLTAAADGTGLNISVSDGIEINSDAIRVKLDGSTLVRTSDGLSLSAAHQNTSLNTHSGSVLQRLGQIESNTGSYESGDIQGVTAGSGISGGGTTGTVVVGLDSGSVAGDGLAAKADGSGLELDLASNKGLEISSGELQIKLDGSTLALGSGGIKLADANLNTSLNSFTASAGDVVTLNVGVGNNNVLQADTGIADDDFLRVNGSKIEGRSASEVLADIGAQASLASTSLRIGTTDFSLNATGSTIEGLTDIDMTAADHTIFNGVGANTLTIGASTTDIVIAGNLTVSGTQTIVNSTTVQYDDNILELNGGGSNNGGIQVRDDEGSNNDTGSLIWDSGEDYWAAGVAGSEKELARLNASPTDNTVLKANSSGLLVDSALSDDGTAVTISSDLIISGLSNNQIVVTNGTKQLTSSTDISSLDLTLDGGQF